MWDGHDRSARLPHDWDARRKRVLERDGYACRVCGAPATDADHIEHGDDHAETNLQALCSYHHRIKSAGEGGRAASARRASANRPAERHPGLRQ